MALKRARLTVLVTFKKIVIFFFSFFCCSLVGNFDHAIFTFFWQELNADFFFNCRVGSGA